jgi:endo-1,4-beta-mannosidase
VNTKYYKRSPFAYERMRSSRSIAFLLLSLRTLLITFYQVVAEQYGIKRNIGAQRNKIRMDYNTKERSICGSTALCWTLADFSFLILYTNGRTP